jgi:hypothetical protein
MIGSADGDIIRRRYDKKTSIIRRGEGGYDETIAGFVGANEGRTTRNVGSTQADARE